MSHRWVQDEKGNIVTHSWVFKEVGIETLLDKLLIKGDIAPEGVISQRDEDELLEAINATGIDEKEETQQVGQITVTFQKVTLGDTHDDWNFRAMHKHAEGDDVDMNESTGGLSHTAG